MCLIEEGSLSVSSVVIIVQPAITAGNASIITHLPFFHFEYRGHRSINTSLDLSSTIYLVLCGQNIH